MGSVRMDDLRRHLLIASHVTNISHLCTNCHTKITSLSTHWLSFRPISKLATRLATHSVLKTRASQFVEIQDPEWRRIREQREEPQMVSKKCATQTVQPFLVAQP